MAPRARGEHAAMLAIEQAVESEALPADLIRQTGGVIGIAVNHVDGDDVAYFARRADRRIDGMRRARTGDSHGIIADKLRGRLPFLDLNRANLRAAEQEGRNRKLGNCRAVHCEVDTRIPREATVARCLKGESADHRLEAAHAHRRAVVHFTRESGRRRQCSLDEQIGNISLEAGELELAAAAEEREVDAPFQLTLPLGTNVGEAAGAGEREAPESGDASRVQGGELLAVLRLIASLAVGDAKLDLIEESRLQLRQTIRARKLREVIELGDVAIVAAAIGAHPRSEQEPLPHQGLALHEDPEILDVQLVVLEVAYRPRDRLGESAEEVLSDGPRLIEVADLVLRADLRGQRQPVLRRVDVYAVEVEIVLKILTIGRHGGTRPTVVRLKLQLGGRVDVIALREDVDAAEGAEPYLMRTAVQRVEVQPAAVHHAPHQLAILQQIDGLKGIARVEWIDRIRPIRALTEIEEARHLRDRVVDRVAGVVVAEQPAIAGGPHHLGAGVERDARAEVLVEIQAQTLLIGESVFHYAVVALEERGYEIAGVVATAADIQRRLVIQWFLTEYQIFVTEVVARVVRRRPKRVAKRVARIEHCFRGRETRELARSFLRCEPRRGETRANRKIRPAACTATLCRDHDDATGRLRAVDRRRRRALQHLDVLD